MDALRADRPAAQLQFQRQLQRLLRQRRWSLLRNRRASRRGGTPPRQSGRPLIFAQQRRRRLHRGRSAAFSVEVRRYSQAGCVFPQSGERADVPGHRPVRGAAVRRPGCAALKGTDLPPLFGGGRLF